MDFLAGENSRTRKWVAPKNGERGVNFIGPVTYLNGLGASSRGYINALLTAGIKLNVIPWRSGFEHVAQMQFDAPSCSVQPVNIVHLNMDLLAGGALNASPLKELLADQRYNIGIFYWELAAIPREWFPVINSFGEIWCASSFIYNSISAVSASPVRLLRPSLEVVHGDGWTASHDFGIPQGRFVFFYAADFGSIVGRKNPKAFLDAYLSEFSECENACCVIKISYSYSGDSTIREILAICKSRQDVVFVDSVLAEEELTKLYSLINCYVSPHRSEGLGLTVIEAMLMGKPVIATPYGGVTDFVNETTAFPLDYKLTEVPAHCWPYPIGFIWADPSLSSLRQMMRWVFEHPNEARERGQAGRTFVRELFSPEQAGKQIASALEEIRSGN